MSGNNYFYFFHPKRSLDYTFVLLQLLIKYVHTKDKLCLLKVRVYSLNLSRDAPADLPLSTQVIHVMVMYVPFQLPGEYNDPPVITAPLTYQTHFQARHIFNDANNIDQFRKYQILVVIIAP